MVCETYPDEACGLLIGTQRGNEALVAQVVRGRNINVERPHDRYEVDPQDFLDAIREAERTDLDIIGVWHSHPDHPACPSETDRSSAWEGWSYLIASVTKREVSELRSWRLRGKAFVEEAIET